MKPLELRHQAKQITRQYFDSQGFIEIDGFQKTTIPGIYACGDNVAPMRSVANAVAMGTLAGAMLNRELVDEAF